MFTVELLCELRGFFSATKIFFYPKHPIKTLIEDVFNRQKFSVGGVSMKHKTFHYNRPLNLTCCLTISEAGVGILSVSSLYHLYSWFILLS